MGLPTVPELLLVISIGSFSFVIWLLSKKKTEKSLDAKENRKPKFCSECGAPLEDNNHFCPVCGTKVVELHNHSKKKFPTKRMPK